MRSQFESEESEGPLPRFKSQDSIVVLVTPYFSFILKLLQIFINIPECTLGKT